MRTLIANGTVVTAEGSQAADVLIDGETIVGIGAGLAQMGNVDRRRHDRCDRQVRHPGRHRRPHPHGAAVRRHVREGHVRDGDPRRGVRRDDDDRRLRGPVEGQEPARGARRLARQGRGQRRRRLRLPHDHERRQRRHAQGDGPARQRGRPRLQAVHRVPRRLLQRRRRDLPGDAADREERRADHDARRERDGHRCRGRADRRRRARPTRSATVWRARRSSRARRPTASSGSPRRPACRSTSSTSRPGRRLAEVRAARDRGSMAFAETCPQYLFLSLDDLGNGFEGAKFVCSPPLRPKDHWDDLWTGLVKDDLQVVSTDHCPFDFHGQKELGRGDFRKIPNGLPGVEDRVDLMHDGGVVGGRITKERWVEIISTAPAKLFGMYPQKGAIAVGADADLVVYDPDRHADDLRQDPPHGRRLLVLRGAPGPGRERRRAVPRLGHRPRRAVHRPQGPRASSSSAPRRLRPDARSADAWPHRRSPLRARQRHFASTGGGSPTFYADVFGCELVPPERDIRSADLDAATRSPRCAPDRRSPAPPWPRRHRPDDRDLLVRSDRGSRGSERGAPRLGPHRVPGPGRSGRARRRPREWWRARSGRSSTTQTSDGSSVTWCYATDPDGNIVELQAWSTTAR